MKSFVRFSKKVLLTGFLVIQIVGLFLVCLTIVLLLPTHKDVVFVITIFLSTFALGVLFSWIPTLIYTLAIVGIIYISKRNGVSNVVIFLQSILLTLVIYMAIAFVGNYTLERTFCIRYSDFQSPFFSISIMTGFLGTCAMVYKLEARKGQKLTKGSEKGVTL